MMPCVLYNHPPFQGRFYFPGRRRFMFYRTFVDPRTFFSSYLSDPTYLLHSILEEVNE